MSETEFRGFDPTSMSGLEAYRLLLHCVSPRPIAFVSSISAEGQANLAPFSFFMAGGASPPSVVFSPTAGREGSPKDTLRNIKETGEYVISVVTYAMRERMNQTSVAYPHGVSEWEEAGFTQRAGVKVRPAHVMESPLALECRLHQIVPHGEGPMSACYVIGEVVYFHAAEWLLEDGHVDPLKVDYIGRMGGDWYTRVKPDAMFELGRPTPR